MAEVLGRHLVKV